MDSDMLALIIDPSPQQQTQLRRALRAVGCDVVSASNREEGHAAWTARPPSLVLCERDLPDGNWRDFLDATCGAEASLLIVTSRLADERLWSEVLNFGGYDVLAKPFEETEVARVLEAALRHLAFRRQLVAYEVHSVPSC